MNGDVRLRVEGLMLERLLERAIQEGARFRAVEPPEDHVMTIDADPHSAAIVQALCERFSMPCTVVARRGRDAMARRLRERATALAGVVVCLMALSAFFGRVWIVDVELTGERDASVAPIEQALSEMGVQPGVAKSEVDADRIESALAASSPDFSFVGVRLQGVRLLVEVAPAVAAPEVYQVDAGRDLVAACDGVVLSVNVETGVACVEPGDTVVRGQVLIRGEERVSSEETRGVAALGSVVARTWTTATASAPLTRTCTERTGRSATSSELCLMGFSWPLTEGGRFGAQEAEVEVLPVGGLFLPLEIRRTTLYETTARETQADEAALGSALSAMALAMAAEEASRGAPEGSGIADSWVEIARDGDALCARAVCESHIDIAVTRDALYQQGG